MKLVALFCLLCALPTQAAELFVAPRGKDTNPGTKARPLATLEAARDRLRALPSTEKKTLVLRAGTYSRQAAFALDARDSGLTLRGEPGARLLGGQIVSDWQLSQDPRLPDAARGKVHQFHWQGDPGTLRRRGMGIATTPAPLELFINGAPQTGLSPKKCVFS